MNFVFRDFGIVRIKTLNIILNKPGGSPSKANGTEHQKSGYGVIEGVVMEDMEI